VADPDGGSETCKANKLNETEWKAQYCYLGDQKVATCPAGRSGDLFKHRKSTDNEALRCGYAGTIPAPSLACEDDGGLDYLPTAAKTLVEGDHGVLATNGRDYTYVAYSSSSSFSVTVSSASYFVDASFGPKGATKWVDGAYGTRKCSFQTSHPVAACALLKVAGLDTSTVSKDIGCRTANNSSASAIGPIDCEAVGYCMVGTSSASSFENKGDCTNESTGGACSNPAQSTASNCEEQGGTCISNHPSAASQFNNKTSCNSNTNAGICTNKNNTPKYDGYNAGENGCEGGIWCVVGGVSSSAANMAACLSAVGGCSYSSSSYDVGYSDCILERCRDNSDGSVVDVALNNASKCHEGFCVGSAYSSSGNIAGGLPQDKCISGACVINGSIDNTYNASDCAVEVCNGLLDYEYTEESCWSCPIEGHASATKSECFVCGTEDNDPYWDEQTCGSCDEDEDEKDACILYSGNWTDGTKTQKGATKPHAARGTAVTAGSEFIEGNAAYSFGKYEWKTSAEWVGPTWTPNTSLSWTPGTWTPGKWESNNHWVWGKCSYSLPLAP
jgi:hypothetical protein